MESEKYVEILFPFVFTRGTGKLMRNYAESAWTAVQAPEVLLAVSGVREEALVFALEVCKYVYEEYSVSRRLKISFLDLFYIFVKFLISWIIEIELFK